MTEPITPARSVEIRVITAADTLPLRLAVLRPNRAATSAQFPGDYDLTARHFGAFRDGQLFGITSLFRVEMTDHPGVPAFQLRGMATAPQARGLGLGTAIVNACLKFARDEGAELLWCNARISAAEFYAKLGFSTVSSEFDIPTVGSHVRMMFPLR
jgi:GNAT superfamily N-acetyltransferase